MVDAKRVGGVLSRRIASAMLRGDDERASKLHRMLVGMNSGRTSPGMVLLELQCYAKVIRNIEPVVRRGHGLHSEERKGWKSDKHRKRAGIENLRGGL
jgi:hypothetical protein